MNRSFLLCAAALLATTISACGHRTDTAQEKLVSPATSEAETSPTPPPAPEPSGLDTWLGKWTGPEGTYLTLSKAEGRYRVEIANLDGPSTYDTVPAGDHFEFQRGGKTESIRAGSGRETGMKWLLEKKDCLVIHEGEGFCRD